MSFSIGAKANYLGPNATLQRGQAIESSLQKYRLIMQTDGSLVMYRQDGSKRYGMAKDGNFAIMQGDGNFVEYSSFATALWATGTEGNPNAYLHIQDDGNLVVYGPTGTPLWHIGADPGPNDPTSSGEVVGRDLNVPGMSWAGHLGFFDGTNVIEAIVPPSGGNAIRIQTVTQFKNASPYWGKAVAKFPNALMVKTCFKEFCSAAGQHYEQTTTKVAMARRSLQIMLLGADYTLSATATRSMYANEYYKAIRGKYRCDTFVADVMAYNSYYEGSVTVDQRRWTDFINKFSSAGYVITPPHLFNSLAAYQ